MKPIIFSTPMVQAILSGNKTQTRRVIKPQPFEDAGGYWHSVVRGHYYNVTSPFIDKRGDGSCCEPWNPVQFVARCAPYKPGDILYVRETWLKFAEWWDDDELGYSYRADGEIGEGDNCHLGKLDKWKPSIHMPREAARIFLRVKSIRPERLHAMTKQDAVKEGISPDGQIPEVCCPTCKGIRRTEGICCPDCKSVAVCFSRLWDSLNADRGYGWNKNPWVWVVEFERIEMP